MKKINWTVHTHIFQFDLISINFSPPVGTPKSATGPAYPAAQPEARVVGYVTGPAPPVAMNGGHRNSGYQGPDNTQF